MLRAYLKWKLIKLLLKNGILEIELYGPKKLCVDALQISLILLCTHTVITFPIKQLNSCFAQPPVKRSNTNAPCIGVVHGSRSVGNYYSSIMDPRALLQVVEVSAMNKQHAKETGEVV